MLVQKNNQGKEQAIYYLNHTLVDYKIWYIYMEYLCLYIIFMAKKLWYYMLHHTTYIISHSNPLQYMMSKTYHHSRTSKWLMFLLEFDLDFVSYKSIKGQFIVDQLIEAPLQDTSSLDIF